MSGAADAVRAYRLGLDAARTRLSGGLRRQFESLPTADLDESYAEFIARNEDVIAGGKETAQTMTTTFLENLADARGILFEPRPELEDLATATPSGTIRESLDAVMPMVKGAIADGKSVDEAMQYGGSLVEKFVDDEMTRTADVEMQRQTEATDVIVGWEGVVQPGSCDACQDNAGEHSLDEEIYRHPGCDCEWVPVFAADAAGATEQPELTAQDEAVDMDAPPAINQEAVEKVEEVTAAQWQSTYEAWATYEQEFKELPERPSFEAFTQAMNENAEKLVAQGEVRIRVGDNDTLTSILEDGRFKSQFETATSSGKLDPKLRSEAESFYFGYGKDTLPTERPIYGYLGGAGDISGVDQYGKIVVELNADARARSTITFSDSLDGYRWNPAITEPNLSHPKGTSLVPQPLDKPTWRAFTPTDPENAQDPAGWHSLHEVPAYPEVQIHHGVTADDIDRVVFTDWNPPSADIIAKLDDAGVPWEHDPDFVKYRR